MSDKRYLGNIITPNPTAPTGDAAKGVWSLSEALNYRKALDWPTLPQAPVIGTATAGNQTATVPFTEPNLEGGTIVQYTATSNPGSITGTNTASPVTVSGLTNDVAYTFTVTATTGAGTGPASAASNSVTPVQPQIALFGAGRNSSNASVNTIDEFDITTTGNATDFGDLTVARTKTSSASSATRGVWAGGGSSLTNVIDYVTIASSGNATDFGDISTANEELAACSNSTRMLIAGGNNGTQINTIEYITIASVGNVTDFGDLTQPTIASGRINTLAALASSTRGVMLGGFNGGLGGETNAIQYVTIASTGNATDFGDLLAVRSGNTGCSDSTRGITWGGGSNTIEYITIASTGNSTDFGDTSINFGAAGSTSGLTRGVIGGGDSGGKINTIEYVTIQSTGNSTDFGDLTVSRDGLAACSSAHGGLS